MKFEKLLRIPVLKNICKHLRTSTSSSSSFKLNLVDLTVYFQIYIQDWQKVNLFTTVRIF